MATKTVVCPECDAPLSPGRFACSSCGALVASIATVSRSFTHVEEILPPVPAPSIPDAPPPASRIPSPARFDEPLPPRLAKVLPPTRRAVPTPRPETPAPTPRQETPAPTVRVTTPAPRAPRRTQRPVAPEQEPLTWVLDEREQALPVTAPLVAPTRAAPPPEAPVQVNPPPEPPMAASPSAEPSWPAHPTWPPPKPVGEIDLPIEPMAPRVAAGAYLPPSAVLPPGESLPIAGHARNGPGEAEGRPEREASPSLRSRFRLGDGTGPAGMPVEIPTRVVVFGAAVAALGFLLPWADIVIGSNALGGYLSQWGLAGPGHVIILALVVGLALLALFAERLPRWVRLGLPSIGVACLLTGIIWPYLIGPFDASIGVYVVAVGAIVIIAGGLLDRVATRHAEAATTV
jgi:hypothetical protein